MLTFLVSGTHVGCYATEGLDQSLVLSSCKNCGVCSRSVDATEGRK